MSPGENSTYHLQFRGPQFRCTTVQYNISVPLDGTPYNGGLIFESKWDSQSLQYTVSKDRVNTNPQDLWNYNVELTEQTCEPVSVLYDVDISFSGGARRIEHLQSNVEALLKKGDVIDDSGLLVLTLPPELQALQDWHQKVITALPAANEWALLDALGGLLPGKFYDKSHFAFPDGCKTETNRTWDSLVWRPDTGNMSSKL
jgi:hypothetical protein